MVLLQLINQNLTEFPEISNNITELYLNDNKGFIKKHKYIVDFIDDNFKNYTNLKNATKGRNEKK